MKFKANKLNIISRCLTSLKPSKSAVIEPFTTAETTLGKRTELICTSNR